MKAKGYCLLLIFLLIASLLGISHAIPKEDGRMGGFKLQTARQVIQAMGLDCSIDEDDVVLIGTSFSIAADETVESDVIIIGGGLVVEGVLYGEAVVIGGSIYLASGAAVKGKVTAVGGIIEQEQGAIIEGGAFEFNYPQYAPQESFHPFFPEVIPDFPESTFDFEYKEGPRLPKELPKPIEQGEKTAVESNDIVRFGGDIHIPRDQVVKGDVVAFGANILVEGRVEGDIVSMGGDISITSDGEVEGDVLTMFGKIDIRPGAKVSGDIVEKSWGRTRKVRTEAVEDTTTQRKHRRDSRIVTGEFDYNRVDGFYLGVLAEKRAIQAMPRYRFKGGYSFKRKRWLYDFAIEQPILKAPQVSAGIQLHDMTESNDDELIGDAENIFVTSFLKKDYKDYFDLRGIAGFAAIAPSAGHRIEVGYSDNEYRPLETMAHASIFRKKWEFEPNPSQSHQICEGDTSCCRKIEIKAINLSYEFDSRPEDFIKTPDRGTWLRISGEWTRKGWGSSYSYDRYWADMRKYIAISTGQQISLRLKIGLFDITPEKKSPCRLCAEPQYFFPKEFYVGGIGTLPGYDYKQFRGTHMVLLNLEYAWQLREHFSALLLFDAGDAKGAVAIDEWKRGELWQELKIKSDAGIGLRYEDPGVYSITVALVKRLVKVYDGDQKPPVLTIRATRMF
ncbi:MAG: BamA/TamA family outer membrane protein [bacterium]